jgi:hypothetical protein
LAGWEILRHVFEDDSVQFHVVKEGEATGGGHAPMAASGMWIAC